MIKRNDKKISILTRVIFATLILLLALSVPATAKAVSLDYEGEITPEMMRDEQNRNETTGNAKNGKYRVTIDDNIQYDTEKQCYVYLVDVGEVYCQAMDGMILQDAVEVSVSEGVNYLIMKDGEQYSLDNGIIKDRGKYTVSVTNNGNSRRVFSFTIVGKEIGSSITEYDLPATFVLSKATFNGENILVDNSYVDFSKEGNYAIEYSSSKNKKKYQLSVKVDHEAPTLALPGVVDGKIRGPLDISDYNTKDKITITLNEKEIKYRRTLTDSGKYVIILSDEAGNTTVYNVFIGFYFNVQTISFEILFVLIIVGMIIYIKISRKRFRVR